MASLRAAGRAFSFGRKKADSQASTSHPPVEPMHFDGKVHPLRDRAYTETSYTSESTATPPKLLGSSLGFSSTDDFGRMFDGLNNRASRSEPHLLANEVENARNGDTASLTRSAQGGPAMPGSSPAAVFTPPMERTFSYERAEETISFPPRPIKSRTMPIGDASSSRPQRSSRTPSDGLQRSSIYTKNTQGKRSSMFQDDDADLVMNSLAVGRKLERASSGGYQYSDEEDNARTRLVHASDKSPSPGATAGAQQYQRVSSYSPGPQMESRYSDSPVNPWQSETANTTPRARTIEPPYEEERSLFDAPPGHLEPSFPARKPLLKAPRKPQTDNKIMTRAQFERYRKQKEMDQSVNPETSEDNSEDEVDEYEDDDEIERNKQIAKQRRKQEAHLSVYRQQMMKVTGEQPLGSSSFHPRGSTDTTRPHIQQRMSSLDINFDKPTDEGKGSEDEEDEDVPLGVLAAHGFPSKNRPPTAMSGRESKIQYKSESYPLPPASTSGTSQPGRPKNLPPFAKHLPQDPYYGASIVNSANRESLGHNHQSPPSVTGSIPPGVPPSGLVGVIADEERARANRRGSPNPQGGMTPPLGSGMNGFGGFMPPQMSAGERATVHMSEQMNQMMQMQMQWMQQMQQMMASGMQFPPGQPMPMSPGQPPMFAPPMMNVPAPTIPGHASRPSTASFQPGSPSLMVPPQGGRTMSMMSPPSSAVPWGQPPPSNRQSRAPSVMNGGLSAPNAPYAASMAPSERSNVGMPSRYRPVSIAPNDEYRASNGTRSSTMNSNTLQPGTFGPSGRLSRSQERKSNLSLRPVTKATTKQPGSDEDDDEGWAEMKKKRDKKKGLWRLNKKKDEPAEPALEYYDYPEA